MSSSGTERKRESERTEKRSTFIYTRRNPIYRNKTKRESSFPRRQFVKFIALTYIYNRAFTFFFLFLSPDVVIT